MAVDFVYRAHLFHGNSDLVFSRLGFVTDTAAKVVVRSPISTNVEIKFKVAHDPALNLIDSGEWATGETLPTSPEHDYVITFKLDRLQPDTEYQYRTNASHVGVFSTLETDPSRFTIISTSCIKPGFPYNPLYHPLSIHGLSHLPNYIEIANAEMMIFLGEFIYIELPRRYGFAVEDYQEAYRQVYASHDWSESLRKMPWVHAYDDHEISNNWSANVTGIFEQAIQPFIAYQHHGNPDSVKSGTTYYSFSRGHVSFFIMDTRRYRSPGMMPDGEGKTMLGEEQLSVFKRWLRTTPGWKVVFSSVPFTINFHSADEEDHWAGYLDERQQLLDITWQTEGVLIITGDRHEHATTAFPISGTNDTRVIEFSTSPLNQEPQLWPEDAVDASSM